jgi:hypothetical protein
MDRLSLIQYKDYGNRSIPKPSHQISIPQSGGYANESTTIDQNQANRSIIPTGYKDAPQYRSIEPQTLGLLGFKAQLNLQGEISLQQRCYAATSLRPPYTEKL